MDDDMVELVDKMRECGWEETPGGAVRHEGLGLIQPTWMDAIKACIEVASEA